MFKVVQKENEAHDKSAGCGGSLLDAIVRDGARQLLAVALQAEVAAYIEAHAHERDEAGLALVVRNGYHEQREVTTSAGAVPVRAPRVNDKRVDEVTGARVRFSSAILPAWARKSPQVAEVLPLLYLHGLSSSDFGPALTQFLGTSHGLSPATITRLTKDWQDEARAFNERSLAEIDYVYVWVDGIHLKVRLEQDKVCLLVMIGVRADGTKELIALEDGHRESSESWADLLRSCQRRGMAAPVLAVQLDIAVRAQEPDPLGMLHPHIHAPVLNRQLDPAHFPRGDQTQQMAVQLGVAHTPILPPSGESTPDPTHGIRRSAIRSDGIVVGGHGDHRRWGDDAGCRWTAAVFPSPSGSGQLGGCPSRPWEHRPSADHQ